MDKVYSVVIIEKFNFYIVREVNCVFVVLVVYFLNNKVFINDYL